MSVYDELKKNFVAGLPEEKLGGVTNAARRQWFALNDQIEKLSKPEILNLKVEDFCEFGPGQKEFANSKEIFSVKDLTRHSRSALLQAGFPASTVNIIQTKLTKYSLALAPEQPVVRAQENKERCETQVLRLSEEVKYSENGFMFVPTLLDLPEPTEQEKMTARLVLKEQFPLFDAVRSGTPITRARARAQLTELHTRLVWSVVYQYPFINIIHQSKDITMTALDMVQEGMLGLCKAIEKFDYTRGLKFSGYAEYWIKQSIQRAIENSGFVRIPTYLWEMVFDWERFENHYLSDHGQLPTEEEVRIYLEVKPALFAKVKQALQLYRQKIQPLQSGRRKKDDDVQGVFEEALGINDVEPAPFYTPGLHTIDPEVQTSRQEVAEKVRAVVNDKVVLTNREREVIKRLYGIPPFVSDTHLLIGRQLGVTEPVVWEIEKSAMKKLRNPKLWKSLFETPPVKELQRAAEEQPELAGNEEDREAGAEAARSPLRQLSITLEQVRNAPNLLDVEKHIVIRRLGLDGNEPETLEQIAGRMGLSRERMRQREASARKKLFLPADEWNPPDEQNETTLADDDNLVLPGDDGVDADTPLAQNDADVFEQIAEAVCRCYRVSRAELTNNSREQPLARARQVVMFLSRQLTYYSFPEIARLLQRHDHTTIIHGNRVVERALLEGDTNIAKGVSYCIGRLHLSDTQQERLLNLKEAMAINEAGENNG